MDLVELTGNPYAPVPNTCLIAAVSTASFAAVAVP